MVKIFQIILLLFFYSITSTANIDDDLLSLFQIDEKKIHQQFDELNKLEKLVNENKVSIIDFNTQLEFNYNLFSETINPQAPLGINSFWWAFSFALVGTYTLYGAGAGPIAVIITYFSSNKSDSETKKAMWGCGVGTILGGALKYLTLQL